MPHTVFASDPLFMRVFRSSPVPMSINTLPEGTYVEVNDAYCRLLAFSREELIGHTALDLGILPSAEERQQLIRRLFDGYPLVNAATTIRRQDGELRQIIVSSQAEVHEGRQFAVHVLQDVTEYLRTQEALTASEARFALFFNSVPLPIWVYDLETLRILDANASAVTTYGYSPDELLSMTVLDIRSPEEQRIFRANLPQLRERVVESSIARHLRKDGTALVAAISGYSFPLNGRLVRLAVMRDITEQLAAERALMESERSLQIVTDLSTDGIWEWDMVTNSFQPNETFLAMFGSPDDPEQTLTWWASRTHPDDIEIAARMFETLQQDDTEQPTTQYRMLLADDKTYANVIVRGHVKRDREGRPTHLTGTIVNITEQIEVAEAATRAALDERRRLARELHDSVTQSLYSVTLLAEVARRRSQVGDADEMVEQIGRLGQLTQQCLREMRLLVYELRPALIEEVGLAVALQHRLEAVEQRAGVRVSFHADNDRDIPKPLQAELFRLAEAALNNALKHAQASTLSLRLNVSNTHASLEIADDGVGLDPVTEYPGRPGLTTMRERIARMGGTVAIQTTRGQGTTVIARVALNAELPRTRIV